MKTAWVTGASGFWGRKVTLSLLRKGYQVVALCRREPAELIHWARSQGHTMIWQPLDLEHPDWEALETLPAPDALFHCAALFDERDVARMVTVNVTHAIGLLELALARMQHAGHGRVGVFLGQNGRLGMPGLAPFSATQGAVWTWAEGQGRALKKSGRDVSISLVFPPRAPSELQGQLAARLKKPPRVKTPKNADALVSGVLTGKRRVGRKPLLAALAMLAS